ncbi:MAG: glyoxalase [Proteobacteria bacterium]|nr:glyoxalase [Pseudomonadota bacterium]
MFILFIRDQVASAAFYRTVLGTEPRLDVPGMTEFALGSGAVLGLMPEAGISRLLDGQVDPAAGAPHPRAELYLRVDEPEACVARALSAGAGELSPMARRGWGDDAAYVADLDGHVIAFARPAPV